MIRITIQHIADKPTPEFPCEISFVRLPETNGMNDGEMNSITREWCKGNERAFVFAERRTFRNERDDTAGEGWKKK